MAENYKMKLSYWLFYGIHLIMVFFAFTGPFLINGLLMVIIYLIISFQFFIFKGCLFNKTHGLTNPNATFYSDLLWKLGISHSDLWITKFVRRFLYPLLALLTLFWQYVLEHEPLWF